MRAKDFDRDEFLSKTWPEALESGEFQQDRGELATSNGYCCLGVACELLSRLKLLRRSEWIGLGVLPVRATRLLKVRENADYGASKRRTYAGGDLATNNDNGDTFKVIARTIRRVHKAKLFEEPTV